MVSRRLEKTKKAPRKLARRNFRKVGELDDEPSVEDLSGARLGMALNYYNYVDLKDGPATRRKWVVDFMESDGEFTDDEIDSVRKMEDWRVTSLAGVSRLISRGAELPPESLASHRARVRDAADRYSRKRAETESKKPAQAEGPAHRKDIAAIAEAEDAVDAVLLGGDTDFSAYDFLTRCSSPRTEAIALGAYYGRIVEELSAIKRYPQLKEAYSGRSKKVINRLMELTSSIVVDADRYVSNRRAATVKKPRKKKEVAASKLVEKLQYMSEYPELQVVSIDPSKMIGASEVWLYSVRYKTLRRLVAESEGSLTVRGSTIHGFDPEKSEQKTLRKPAEGIRGVLDGTPYSIKKLMPMIKTKSSVPNGRVNSETIILRALR